MIKGVSGGGGGGGDSSFTFMQWHTFLSIPEQSGWQRSRSPSSAGPHRWQGDHRGLATRAMLGQRGGQCGSEEQATTCLLLV